MKTSSKRDAKVTVDGNGWKLLREADPLKTKTLGTVVSCERRKRSCQGKENESKSRGKTGWHSGPENKGKEISREGQLTILNAAE